MTTHEAATIRDLLGKVKAVQIGMDLGQKQDPSAIVLCEVGERPSNRTYRDWRTHEIRQAPEATYRVQQMERLDLGTAYVDVAARLVQLVAGLWEWEKRLRTEGALQPEDPQLPWDIWVDVTGLGNPVVELIGYALEAEPRTRRAKLHPVVFTHGDRLNRGAYDGGRGDVLGKAFLVSRLQVLLQRRTLQLPPKHAEAQAMARELKDYEIHVDENANDKYGAFRVGTHDDLVTALGLACIEEPGYYGVESGPNLWP